MIARSYLAEHLVAIQHTAECVLYYNLISQISLLPYHHIYFIALLILRHLFRQIVFYLGRSHDTVTFFVKMSVHHVASAFLHLSLLLAERHKEVFHQPPVKKRSELVYPCHFKASELINLHIRLKCGSHESFIHIQIDKDIQHITRSGAFGNISLRKQDFAVFISIKIYSEIYFFHYF